jgi:hypothetical protein
MTENDWLGCGDPRPMLEFLQANGRASDRKLRLFAVACCRRIWQLLTAEQSREAVEIAERYADDTVSKKDLTEARQAVRSASWDAAAAKARQVSWDGPGFVAWCCVRETMPSAVKEAARTSAFRATAKPVHFGKNLGWQVGNLGGEQEMQATLLRDIFGNPFQSPPALDPSLLNHDAIVRLAQFAYDDRDMPAGTLNPGRLAELADALEAAGCRQQNVLGHLRGDGPHVRGCHVVDLVLGKA